MQKKGAVRGAHIAQMHVPSVEHRTGNEAGIEVGMLVIAYQMVSAPSSSVCIVYII